ncbi:MAG: 16S rRNA (adenine(1518)-N(6)/adenine(1519)-N(6))-dimethyltransferase RsmA [Methylococcaceae bacterium]|nr:16S rRNA (adenine(1518)-N(6)/adenine(1519)-N(6))-dimethyltransferase RsmA [Methylococcaceae bacterium]MCI0734241.1 16S rRNA (adenine(1518)-N(6)/adenine(1519)-N(6))-dimethyltransferase RsmA [Methylococcaceae bacterium]
MVFVEYGLSDRGHALTHRPRKRFGQNFLHDPSVVSEILAAIDPKRHEHLVEIGPGTGALTDPLLSRCDCLDVIEIDRDLAAHLKIRFSVSANLNVVCADVLNVRLTDFRKCNEALRIIGNLPYNISTPLLFHLLEQQSCIQDMHFMLQKEVVDRICAEPGSKAFGRLSIMLQFLCEAEKLFEVSSNSFRPAPKVSSAVVRLTPRSFPEYPVDVDAFKTLVGQAFSRRRKTLRNALKGYLSPEEIASTGVNPSARAETVDIAGFARLSDLYFEKKSRCAC